MSFNRFTHWIQTSSSTSLLKPAYPSSIFEFAASHCTRKKLAWDCGTGNGAAARCLSPFFSKVVGSDALPQTNLKSYGPPNIMFKHFPAEYSDFAPGRVDLTVCSQSVHWFDMARFFEEVERVSQPDGLILLMGYGAPYVVDDSKINDMLNEFRALNLDPFWPPEHSFISEKYKTIPFPFKQIPIPKAAVPSHLSMDMNLEEFIGHHKLWTAAAVAEIEHGVKVDEEMNTLLKGIWQNKQKKVEWEFFTLLGKVSDKI